MIQRSQSVYLLIVFVLSLLMFFVPFAKFIGDAESFSITVWGIKDMNNSDLYVIKTLYMGVLIAVATAMSFVNIFLFKKRLIQIRLCMIQIVLYIGSLSFVCYYIIKAYNTVSNLESHSMVVSIVSLIPIASIVLSYLAFRGVARDEALVRSLDRIR